MHAFNQIPSELFYQIALHLPLTRDVLAFRLANTLICDALSTPALFKARLELRRWDVSAWNDEDNATRSAGDFERWARIDHIFCRTAQLFDETTAEGYFLMTTTSNSPLHSGVVASDPGSGDDDGSLDLGLDFDEEKTVAWLRKLSVVLPLFVTHHRGGNISRITEEKHLDSLGAYAIVVDNFCTNVKVVLSPDGIPEPAPTMRSSERSWFEPICFSLIALLLQCDAETIVTIFTDNCEDSILFQESTSSAFGVKEIQSPFPALDILTHKRISERYSAVFFFQTVHLAALHLDAAQPGVPQPPLPAPSLPYFDPHSSSLYYSHPYNVYGAHVKPGAIPTDLSGPLRPWLQDGLPGTLLADLSSMVGCAWAGYYTSKGMEDSDRDPPMYIELRTDPGEDTESAHGLVVFHGEGHDGVGKFVIIGLCDTRTGVVGALKAYEMHQWEWRGMLTPFGMAGMWGSRWEAGSNWGRGWWWIWPREWSSDTTRHD